MNSVTSPWMFQYLCGLVDKGKSDSFVVCLKESEDEQSFLGEDVARELSELLPEYLDLL